MEAHRHFGKLGLGGRSKGLPSRRNATLVAVLSAVLAAALIYLFVTHYNKNANQTPTAPVTYTVWEATKAIPAGTPESVIAAGGYFKPVQVTQVTAPGAISDPTQVVGEVTNTSIAAKQQISASDFTKPVGAGVSADLRGNQRAVAFSFDSQHGLTTSLTVGSTVDVMVVMKSSTELVAQNVTVLQNQQGLVVLKLTDKQALLVTAATTKGSLWLSLRPALDAKNSIQVNSVGS